MLLILLILFVILAAGGLPAFGYTSTYYPSGLFTLLILILLIMLITGRRF